MAPLYLALFLSFSFFYFPVGSSLGNATLSAQSLDAILCLNRRLRTSDFCKNLSRSMGGVETTTSMAPTSTTSINQSVISSTLPIIQSSTSSCNHSLIIHNKIAPAMMNETAKGLIGAGLSVISYILVVCFLHFYYGLPWLSALRVGLRRGHLCPCHFHFHTGNIPAVELEMAAEAGPVV